MFPPTTKQGSKEGKRERERGLDNTLLTGLDGVRAFRYDTCPAVNPILILICAAGSCIGAAYSYIALLVRYVCAYVSASV